MEEALRLDQDTQGVPGTPEIANTILKKIDECDIFLCDLTVVATTADSQQVPNPNVLIELGYAMKSIGTERIIAVMNENYGTAAAGLPFDLQHRRWPIRYLLSAEAAAESLKEQKNSLISRLEEAIKVTLSSKKSQLPATSPPPFPAAEPKNGKARFRSSGEPIGILWESSPFPIAKKRTVKQIFLSNGPAMWLRLMPIIDPATTWSAQELKDCAVSGGTFNLDPFYGGSNLYLRAADGFGVYAPTAQGESDTTGVAFAFETGEIWSIDVNLLGWDPEHPRLIFGEIEKQYTKHLKDYTRFLQCLGIEAPYRWICGLEGMKYRELILPQSRGHVNMFPGQPCLAEVVTAEGTFGPEEAPAAALRPFFDLIFRMCGMQRPDHLNH